MCPSELNLVPSQTGCCGLFKEVLMPGSSVSCYNPGYLCLDKFCRAALYTFQHLNIFFINDHRARTENSMWDRINSRKRCPNSGKYKFWTLICLSFIYRFLAAFAHWLGFSDACIRTPKYFCLSSTGSSFSFTVSAVRRRWPHPVLVRSTTHLVILNFMTRVCTYRDPINIFLKRSG